MAAERICCKWKYRWLAEWYLLKNDVENAYQALLCAKMHVEAFDLRKARENRKLRLSRRQINSSIA